MLRRISIVLAQWCPHCVPLSLERAEQISKALGVELRVLDIDDPVSEKTADQLVAERGDWAEDYLIPQVFFEYDNGDVNHVFTGFSEGVHVTKARWEDFLASKLYQKELKAHRAA